MATCYQCGSAVAPGDRFCMACGAPNPAGAQNLSPASAAPTPGIPHATTPTWYPPDSLPVTAPPAAPLPAAVTIGPPAAIPPSVPPQAVPVAGVPDPAAALTCSNCSAALPPGARFCGDCGAHIAEASVSVIAQVPTVPPSLSPVPAFAATPAVQPAVLPDPIPPLAGATTRPPDPTPTPPVLPAFQPPAWMLNLGAEPVPFAGAPVGTSGAAGVVVPFPGQPFIQAPGTAQPFLAPGFAPPGALPAPIGRRPHPRSQVITMIVAGIVSLVFAVAGIITQLLFSR
jgi:ribosomal protein L40E